MNIIDLCSNKNIFEEIVSYIDEQSIINLKVVCKDMYNYVKIMEKNIGMNIVIYEYTYDNEHTFIDKLKEVAIGVVITPLILPLLVFSIFFGNSQVENFAYD